MNPQRNCPTDDLRTRNKFSPHDIEAADAFLVKACAGFPGDQRQHCLCLKMSFYLCFRLPRPPKPSDFGTAPILCIDHGVKESFPEFGDYLWPKLGAPRFATEGPARTWYTLNTATWSTRQLHRSEDSCDFEGGGLCPDIVKNW